MKKALELAVIGGGASGLFAAVSAAGKALECGLSVKITVYESNARTGKKILATGNGRCNFTNENITEQNFHGDSSFAYEVYKAFDNKKTAEAFRLMGLMPKSDFAGRVYPLSFQASSVLDSLRYETARLKIKEITDTKITSVKKTEQGFILNGEYYADRVILACGGKASPVHGSDGSGFKILEDFGIYPEKLTPALVPLNIENFKKGLKGIRAQGKISIKSAGRILAEDTGEIQYTDYGLSGIPTMQVSGAAGRELAEGDAPVFAVVDSAPYMSAQELKSTLSAIIKRNPQLPCEMLLAGIMPKKLGVSLLTDCSVNPVKESGIIHGAVIDKIVRNVKEKKYKISSVRGFSEAQVTAGGIKAGDIDINTLELEKVRGMYVCGEIINVHGDCGGYNLQWAWSSGYRAGINAVREK